MRLDVLINFVLIKKKIIVTAQPNLPIVTSQPYKAYYTVFFYKNKVYKNV